MTIMMMRALVVLAALHAAPACAQSMDEIAGSWAILDPAGARIGESTIVVQAPNAMIFEERRVGADPVQQLWFENSEAAGGWVQLFVSPRGIRAFAPVSAPGEWPIVLGARVTLQSGAEADFRMTMSRESADRHRRLLEISTDGSLTWSTVFDFRYRRIDTGD